MSPIRHLPVIVALLLTTATATRAQLQWSKWLFGYNASLDFAGSVLQLIPGSALRTIEGSASVADGLTGELYFYTDGRSVWNREHRRMPSGIGLRGHASSTQSALVVPDPGDAARFYIFTADACEDLIARDGSYDGLNYSIVDMTRDGGFGDVAVKNVRLAPTFATEKLCAVRVCSDGTYWVIAHEADGDAFYAYHVTAAGVSEPVVSRVGQRHRIYSIQQRRVSDLPGQMKSSADGARIAVVHGGAGPEIFDFDQSTGRLSLALRLAMVDAHLYGVAFSPDGTKLFALQNIVGGLLVQYDLAAGSEAQVSASRVVLAQYSSNGGSLQLAPDGRIYVAIESSDALDVVAEPNRAGAACRLLRGTVGLGGALVGAGLPNIIDSELGLAPRPIAGPDTAICPGDSVRLSVSGGRSHRWRPAASLNCSDCPSPIARPEATTRYIVETLSAGGCRTTDTVVVAVHDAASVDAGAARSICAGDTATLAVTGGIRWEWFPSIGLSCADCPSPRAFPTRTTTYRVVAYSAGGCVATDSVRVLVNAIPRVVAGGDTTVCAGRSVALHASGAASYRWEPADGLSCSDCPDPIATATTSRVYRVVGTTAEGCTAADSVRVTVARTATVTARIDSIYRATVGAYVVVPIRVDDPDAILGESSLELDVMYDENILLLSTVVPAGTLIEGGSVSVVRESPGAVTYRIRPGTRRSDTLVRLVFRTFVGDTIASAIDIGLRPTNECLTIVARGGGVRLDSLCGLPLRLIEFVEPLTLRAAAPNPFDDVTRLQLFLPTAAQVRVRVIDATGAELQRVLDATLADGAHALIIDGRRLPRGGFTVVAEAAGSTATARIVRR